MIILNIAGGNINPLDLNMIDTNQEPTYLLNVDTAYFSKTKISNIELDIEKWEGLDKKVSYCNMDVFEFMEKTILKFDYVSIYRFLEHVPFVKVPYFIYLVSTILKPGGTVDVIVPNYRILADMIVNEELTIEDINNHRNDRYGSFESFNIELTTELLNEPSNPHASIWTPYRAKYFWEMENRFYVDTSADDDHFDFDGRKIYLRFFANRL